MCCMAHNLIFFGIFRNACLRMFLSMCVCVYEREGGRERENYYHPTPPIQCPTSESSRRPNKLANCEVEVYRKVSYSSPHTDSENHLPVVSERNSEGVLNTVPKKTDRR